jgi:hypothetical protein
MIYDSKKAGRRGKASRNGTKISLPTALDATPWKVERRACPVNFELGE